MARLNMVVPLVAGVLSLGGCKTFGLNFQEKYPADRIIVATVNEALPWDPSAARDAARRPDGDAAPDPIGIGRLLCEHSYAVHHPYKYLNSCVQARAT
jgi:hypothetical protein